MKHLLIAAMYFILQSPFLQAQLTDVNVDTAAPVPAVVIIQDERIEVLTAKKIFIPGNTETKTDRDTKQVKVDKFGRVNIPGFRLQLMNSNDRASVYDMKGKLYQLYPHIKQYVVAQAPFYKLRFGNFKTKDEADRYKKALAPMFPGGIYIVNDIIEGQIDPKSKALPKTKDAPKTTSKPAAKPAAKPKAATIKKV